MSTPQNRPPGATVPAGQPENPEVTLVEGPDGQVTLSIAGGQAVQGWERSLMCESADILCTYGSQFLEVGLGLGLSALRIAQHPNTRRHLVIEKYEAVIDLFHKLHPCTPSALRVVHADFFEFVPRLEPASFDGVFFDPSLPMSLWNDERLWEEVVPRILSILRPGGVLIPFFSTTPVLRKQFVRTFNRVIVERRSFTAYPGTLYTHGISGDAYIQCFVKDG